jgi:hypothetical protein
MIRMIALLLLFSGANAVADAQAVLLSPTATQIIFQPTGTSLNANVFEQVRYADQFPGADPCVQINSAILDLAANGGGVVDARAFKGNVSCSGGVNLNIPVRLLLGAANFSWSFAGAIFTITTSGCSIEGLGRFKSTTLAPPAGSTAIYAAQGLDSTAIRHLYIAGQNSSTPSFAIQIDAAASPANNPTFMIEDVYVYGGFAGIQAIRPINSTLKDVRVSNTVADGFTFIGDGTTVACINCYANGTGGNGFHVSGIANATFIGGEADTNGGDGLLADMSSASVGTTGLTLSGLDIEANKGNGLHLINAAGTSISGSVIINNTSDGIQMCGGIGLSMSGGRLGANGGYAVDLAPSGCSYTGSNSAADVAVVSPRIDPANAAGILNDPRHIALAYLPSQLSPLSSATVLLGGALWGVGSGAPSGSCTTGSIYSNLSGGGGTTLYVCEAAGWSTK